MNILLCILFFFISSVTANNQIVYLSPLDGSTWQSTETSLIIGFNESVPDISNFSISGSISGEIDCNSYISSSRNRLVLTPIMDFALGEIVNVTLSWPSNSTEWSFTVRPENTPEVFFSCIEEQFSIGGEQRENRLQRIDTGRLSDGVSVPLDFPELILNTSGQPSEGNYFLGTLTANDATSSSYLIIADNDGEPLFYWHWNKGIFCVEVQPGDLLTLGTRLPGNATTWLVINDTYAFQDSFTVVGYPTDIHDMTMRENGNTLLIGVDARYIDMSLVVPGGDPNALVQGLLVQEQDENHMPIFQWSSFDHFEITDAAHFVDLTASFVDYVHCNSISEDPDGNILLSCLALGECTKIDQTTGDIIWRFGGLDADSSWFTMIGDPLGGFSAQHDFNSSEPGLYTVFDNGRFHSPQVSRGLEYQLDTNAMTATLVWSYIESGLFGTHLGSVQHLPGGNYIVGWGDIQGTTTFPDFTEVNPDGTEEHSMRFTDPVLESYKAYKYNWEGQALVPYLMAQVDSPNNTAVLTYNVFGENQFELYRIWQGTSSSQLAPLFLTSERQVSIWELPTGWNYFAVTALDSNQVETGFSNIDSVFVNWTGINSDSDFDLVTPVALVFPNPATSIVNLLINSTENGDAEIDFFDITGRIVLSTDKFPVQPGGICRTVAIGALPPGLYTVRISGNCVEFTENIVILR